MKEDIHLKKPISDPQQHKEKILKNYCHRRQRCVSNNRRANYLNGRWIEMENKENRKNEELNELNEEELSKANGGRILSAINNDFLDTSSIVLMSNDKKKKKPKKIDS